MARQQQWTKEERRELLCAQEESGLSATAFAEAAGLPRSTLTSWRRRLAEREAGPGFVRVVAAAPVAGAADAWAEVVVGDAVVRVGPGVDEALLARVVRVVRSC
jgi:transposase-like protein